MVARFLLYPLVLLLAYGNLLYSESSHSPTYGSFVDRIERTGAVVFDNTRTADLLEEAFQVIVEENSTENNDNDDSNDTAGAPAPQPSLFQPCSTLSAECIAPATDLIPAGKALPLYLLHRVFRI